MNCRRPENPFYLSILKYCLPVLLLLVCRHGYAQKYNFINLNVENGLAQSQVTVFAQDKNNELLVGTLGGLSIFDGTNCTNYTKSKGLSQNQVYALSCDRSYHIWIGTSNGISRFDGKQFKTFRLSNKPEENTIRQIETDGHNRVWVLSSKLKLYFFDGKRFREEKNLDSITAITLDKSGNIWAAGISKGIFVMHGNTWKKEILQESAPPNIFRIIFGNYTGTLYCLTNRGLFTYENGRFEQPEWTSGLPYLGFVAKMMEDSRGNIWLSAGDGGAWLYSPDKLTHFTYQNGLTDDKAVAFYEDTEGNVWIGTDGSGIFRYTGGTFTYYDRTSGLASPSVMSIAQNKKGETFLASINSGLYKLKNGAPEKIKMPPFTTRINTLLTDSLGNLWIGTDQLGLWHYDGQSARLFRPSIEQNMLSVVHLNRSGSKIWIASQDGLFRIQDKQLFQEPVNNLSIYATHVINEDSLLVGTIKGAYVYHTAKGELVPQPLIANSTTLCFASDTRNIYIGTDDKGLAVWNRSTRKLYYINQRSGLSCDYIYSLLRDHNGNIWVGTGCGIDKITFTEQGFRVRSFGRSDGLLGVENNANASFEDREGFLWFGTTKGVFRYNPYLSSTTPKAPKVILQSVKLFSKDIPAKRFSDSTQVFSNLPWNPILPPGQNHLTFTFKGIYLSNPEKIRYRYQLAGIDKAFTETDQTTVVYPNLPPGTYLFKVWASDADGNWYNNAITYPFTINAPYYTTWYFRTGIALLLIGIFLAAVYYRNRQKELRRRWEEQLREREQALVRKKTAEDFHDEIGNKLTRINLLATIAEAKLNKPAAEIQPILQQIQQNVTSLYNGSKDIIWSLQPESDYLDEIMLRIRQNTSELLQDTDIRFDYIQQPDMDVHIRLPIDYSRNLIMIFKEAVNNIVKHAGASIISFSIKQDDGQIQLELADNGKGFDEQTSVKGNGLGNMSNRAQRIGARLECYSRPGEGTRVTIFLKQQV